MKQDKLKEYVEKLNEMRKIQQMKELATQEFGIKYGI